MQDEHAKNQQNEPDEETADFSKPDYVFTPKGIHTYRQEGYYLICRSCEIQHAVWIGADKIMVGVDKKGQPILKKRKEA